MTTPEPAADARAARRARLAQLADIHHQWTADNPTAEDDPANAAEDELHRAVDAAGIFPDL